MKAVLIIWIIAISGNMDASPGIQMRTVNFESVELCRQAEKDLKHDVVLKHKIEYRTVGTVIQTRCIQTGK